MKLTANGVEKTFVAFAGIFNQILHVGDSTVNGNTGICSFAEMIFGWNDAEDDSVSLCNTLNADYSIY
jgi:hypothetical protein